MSTVRGSRQGPPDPLDFANQSSRAAVVSSPTGPQGPYSSPMIKQMGRAAARGGKHARSPIKAYSSSGVEQEILLASDSSPQKQKFNSVIRR